MFNSITSLLEWTQKCQFGQNLFGSSVANVRQTTKEKMLLQFAVPQTAGRIVSTSKLYENSLDGQNAAIFCTQWPEKERNGDVGWKDISELTLVTSNDFFQTKNEILLGGGVPTFGIINSWMVVVVSATTGLQLITSKDGKEFFLANFVTTNGGMKQLNPISFSILESTPSSLFVDVVSTSRNSRIPIPIGTLFVSSSDGKYFTPALDHTNRDLATNLVDVESFQSNLYEGILLANTVKNWKDFEKNPFTLKMLVSRMSFDNGRRWNPLPAPTKDLNGNNYPCTPSGPTDLSCSLHLHSVSTLKNIGKVFSISSAPGTILGVGNVGEYLYTYDECDTFISNDSGLSWTEVQKGPHKYEILDFGSIICLVPDGPKKQNYILYSKNRGISWEKYDFMIDNSPWIPLFTHMEPNSSSKTMIIISAKENLFGDKYLTQVNFEKIFDRKCNLDQSSANKDLELYQLEYLNAQCVLGSLKGHYRRKAEANCFVDTKFNPKPVVLYSCKCTILDYECDSGYYPDSKSDTLICLSDGTNPDQPFDCKKGSQYKGSSGYKFIPGNQCKGGEDQKANPILKDCKNVSKKPISEPLARANVFVDHIFEMLQVPLTSIFLILTKQGVLWKSSDDGASWVPVEMPESQRVFHIQSHRYVPERIFIFTRDNMYYTEKMNDIIRVNTPESFNLFGIAILDHHPEEKDWYVFIGGGRDCATNICHSSVYMTKDNGKSFTKIDTWATKCQWAAQLKTSTLSKDSIICAIFKDKNGSVGQDKLQSSIQTPVQLVLSGDNRRVLLDINTLDFFILDSAILVATNDIELTIIYTSVNGNVFMNAQFPPDISLKYSSFTILTTSVGCYMEISQNQKSDAPFGTLYKLGQDGRHFLKILDTINRSPRGFGNHCLI
jgi:hypothetical protein